MKALAGVRGVWLRAAERETAAVGATSVLERLSGTLLGSYWLDRNTVGPPSVRTDMMELQSACSSPSS